MADDMLAHRLGRISREYDSAAARGLLHAAGAAAVFKESQHPRNPATGEWITGQPPRIGSQVQVTHGPHKLRSGTIVGHEGPPNVVIEEHGTRQRFTVHERHYRVTR